MFYDGAAQAAWGPVPLTELRAVSLAQLRSVDAETGGGDELTLALRGSGGGGQVRLRAPSPQARLLWKAKIDIVAARVRAP